MASFAPLRRTLAHPSTFARTFSSTPASQLARVNLIGRIGTVPELQTTNSGKEIVRYVLGTNYGIGENKEVSWWNIAYFGDGDRKDYLLRIPKGALVYVEAEARMRKIDRPDGTKDNVLSMTQSRIELLKKPAQQDSKLEETEREMAATA